MRGEKRNAGTEGSAFRYSSSGNRKGMPVSEKSRKKERQGKGFELAEGENWNLRPYSTPMVKR